LILARMLEELQDGADIVVGSRHVEGGSARDWNRLRRIQSWIANKMAQLLLGIRLKDPMSGYFLVWRKDFYEIREHLNGKGFKILLEILSNLHAPKIIEVPYAFRSRTQGHSKLCGRIILQFFHQLWRLCNSNRRHSSRLTKSAV
jgi:dolichol-phosphate mannosyltransferase